MPCPPYPPCPPCPLHPPAHCPLPAPAPQLDHGEMTGWATAVLAALPPAHVRLLLTDPARTRTPGTPGHVAVTMPVAMTVAHGRGPRKRPRPHPHSTAAAADQDGVAMATEE